MLIPEIIGVTLAVFLLMHLAPGDPVALIVGDHAPPEVYEQVRAEFGLDKPLVVQYWVFLKHLCRLDLGRSILMNRPVTEVVAGALPVTLQLTLTGLVVSYLIGVPVGIVSGVKRGSLFDQASMFGAIAFACMPSFWLGSLLMLSLGVRFAFFPVSGYGSIRHMILPSVSLGLGGAALTARMMRSSILDVIRMDYVQTARAKGLPESAVVYKHALRNALIPMVTLLGLRLGWLVGGAVSLETVFSVPGMGRFLVNSILNRDYPMVQGIMLVLALCVVIGNFLADLLYSLVDPRVELK
ncbi:MAG: ABC transporter permease [Firmicutes bacterium]|nr:ABC transporter permease [Bacillota bacterium]